MADFSPEARKMMRSALGLRDGNKKVYRNRYFLHQDSDGFGDWCRLVLDGYAIHHGPSEGQMHLFAVTTKGFEAVAQVGEKPDREEAAAFKEYDARKVDNSDLRRFLEK